MDQSDVSHLRCVQKLRALDQTRDGVKNQLNDNECLPNIVSLFFQFLYGSRYEQHLLVIPQDDHITVVFFPGFQLASGK